MTYPRYNNQLCQSLGTSIIGFNRDEKRFRKAKFKVVIESSRQTEKLRLASLCWIRTFFYGQDVPPLASAVVIPALPHKKDKKEQRISLASLLITFLCTMT